MGFHFGKNTALPATSLWLVTVNDPRQDGTVFDAQSLKAALKQVAAFGSKAIKPSGVGAFQPMHTGRKVRQGSLHGQVEVIIHQYVGMQTPAEAAEGCPEGLLKRGGRAYSAKDRVTVIPSIDDVV